MHTKDAHLYRPASTKGSISTNKATPKATPSGATFSSAFSSLLSTASTGNSSVSNARPSANKNDIFATHNRGTKKRAAADMFKDSEGTNGSSENLDDASWRRAKRKMDEKARLYAKLKRGDMDDRDERYGVDFDRKWAERDGVGSSDESEQEEANDEEIVEWEDEFGRTRNTSRREFQKEQRLLARQQRAGEDDSESRLRPVAPQNVIYGDAIQTQAFDLDEGSATKMEQLAQKRDKEETPPPDEHYDASAEVRAKGTGFYQFSKDEDIRQQQLKDLEQMSMETDKARGEKATQRETEKERRKRELEERRKLVKEKKSRIMAERFLSDLEQQQLSNAPHQRIEKDHDSTPG